jgi:hypothetical protein
VIRVRFRAELGAEIKPYISLFQQGLGSKPRNVGGREMRKEGQSSQFRIGNRVKIRF